MGDPAREIRDGEELNPEVRNLLTALGATVGDGNELFIPPGMTLPPGTTPVWKPDVVKKCGASSSLARAARSDEPSLTSHGGKGPRIDDESHTTPSLLPSVSKVSFRASSMGMRDDELEKRRVVVGVSDPMTGVLCSTMDP